MLIVLYIEDRKVVNVNYVEEKKIEWEKLEWVKEKKKNEK